MATNESIVTAATTARENPTDAAGAIRTLFDYVDNGGTDAIDASMSLYSIAKRTPETFEGQTDNFERVLKTADGIHARRELADAVTELIDHHAIPLARR